MKTSFMIKQSNMLEVSNTLASDGTDLDKYASEIDAIKEALDKRSVDLRKAGLK